MWARLCGATKRARNGATVPQAGNSKLKEPAASKTSPSLHLQLGILSSSRGAQEGIRDAGCSVASGGGQGGGSEEGGGRRRGAAGGSAGIPHLGPTPRLANDSRRQVRDPTPDEVLWQRLSCRPPSTLSHFLPRTLSHTRCCGSSSAVSLFPLSLTLSRSLKHSHTLTHTRCCGSGSAVALRLPWGPAPPPHHTVLPPPRTTSRGIRLGTLWGAECRGRSMRCDEIG